MSSDASMLWDTVLRLSSRCLLSRCLSGLCSSSQRAAADPTRSQVSDSDCAGLPFNPALVCAWSASARGVQVNLIACRLTHVHVSRGAIAGMENDTFCVYAPLDLRRARVACMWSRRHVWRPACVSTCAEPRPFAVGSQLAPSRSQIQGTISCTRTFHATGWMTLSL